MINLTNLRILRDYLESNFERIQELLCMDAYITVVDDGPLEMWDLLPTIRSYRAQGQHWCGSTGCLLGHGLMSGLPTLTPDVWPNMARYQQQTYGETLHIAATNAMNFMFSAYWPDDLEQGIRRIDYVLDHDGGVPDDWCWGKWTYVLEEQEE